MFFHRFMSNRKLGASVELKSMHEYDMSLLPTEQLVAFVCSVTGQGEEPDTMKVPIFNPVILEVFVEEIASTRFSFPFTIRSLWPR